MTGGDGKAGDRADRGQRLAAKPERADRQQVFIVKLGRGVPVDRQFEVQGVKVVVDEMSLMYLVGTEIDYVEGLQGAGFKFNNPNVKTTCGCVPAAVGGAGCTAIGGIGTPGGLEGLAAGFGTSDCAATEAPGTPTGTMDWLPAGEDAGGGAGGGVAGCWLARGPCDNFTVESFPAPISRRFSGV